MVEGEGEEQWEEEGPRLAGGWATARVYRVRGCAELGRHVLTMFITTTASSMVDPWIHCSLGSSMPEG